MTSIFLEQSWHHHRHGTIRQWAATRGGGEPSGESFDFSQEERVLLPSNMNCLSQALACLFPKQRATCILLHFAIGEEREEHRIETSVGHNQPVAWQLFDDFLTGFRIHRANQQWGYGMLWTHVDKCHQMSSNVIKCHKPEPELDWSTVKLFEWFAQSILFRTGLIRSFPQSMGLF